MPLNYEATISCNKEKCKTDNLTSDPWGREADAVTDVENMADISGWKCEDLHAGIYFCPEHQGDDPQ